VWTSRGFSWQTRKYWLLTTGAGTALLLAAILGLIVGLVIVAQTLYSATVERMAEFATIRAMGANDRYLTTIIVHQSLIGGSLGYFIGTTFALVLGSLAKTSSVAVNLPFALLATLAIVTLVMCTGAAVVPIRKVLNVDAASIFR
jgi:putative ABC transport system permease protein